MVQILTPWVTPNRGMGPREALFVKLLWPLVLLYDGDRKWCRLWRVFTVHLRWLFVAVLYTYICSCDIVHPLPIGSLPHRGSAFPVSIEWYSTSVLTKPFMPVANKSTLRNIMLVNFSNCSRDNEFCSNLMPFSAIAFIIGRPRSSKSLRNFYLFLEPNHR